MSKKSGGNPVDLLDMTDNHHAHAKRVRAQIADRPKRQFAAVSSRTLLPHGVRCAAHSIYRLTSVKRNRTKRTTNYR